jgi:hypothetical protein
MTPSILSQKGCPENLKNNLPNFSKSCPNSLQAKKGQNIYNKAQFERPNYLHQTTFENLKCLQQTMLFRRKCNKFA